MLITSLEQAQAEMVEELENREATGDSGRGGGGGGSNKEYVPPAIKCDDCNTSSVFHQRLLLYNAKLHLAPPMRLTSC